MDKEFTPLSSFLSAVLDCRGKTPKKLGSDWSESGYRVLSANNVTHDGLKEIGSIRCVDEITYLKWMKREIENGDLLLTSEAPAGQVMLWDSDEKIVLGQRLFGLRAKKATDGPFLKYYLQSPLGQKAIRWRTSGSTVSGVSAKMFDCIPVIAKHSPSTRKRIGEVLSNLDRKIALNSRINKKLEGMAKSLYDYWFVQFDFPMTAAHAAVMGKPRLASKPYRASGGKMVYNDALKREIPDGWEGGNVLAIAELGGGATPSKKAPGFWGGDIPFFTPTDAESEPFCLDTEDHITQLGLGNSATRLYSKGTLFITARGSVGKAMIISRAMAMSQSCYALCPMTGVGSAFLYFHTLSLMDYLHAKSSGSIFKSIVTNDINFTPAIVPASEQLAAYNEVAEPIFESILTNQEQNQQLTELRDWLLPMLMNGQISVC